MLLFKILILGLILIAKSNSIPEKNGRLIFDVNSSKIQPYKIQFNFKPLKN